MIASVLMVANCSQKTESCNTIIQYIFSLLLKYKTHFYKPKNQFPKIILQKSPQKINTFHMKTQLTKPHPPLLISLNSCFFLAKTQVAKNSAQTLMLKLIRCNILLLSQQKWTHLLSLKVHPKLSRFSVTINIWSFRQHKGTELYCCVSHYIYSMVE